MHTLLQQFGRETSRKQFVHHGLGKRQLLVSERDTCELLSDDSTDGRRFVGTNFDISESEEELEISEKSLERMSDVQFVRTSGKNDRVHSLLCHSQKIRSLDWIIFQNKCLPSTFNPEFLVRLVMGHNKLQKLWEGTKPLRNLRWMDLIYSSDLKELPDLSTATNLKEFNLKCCSNLAELPLSIKNATKLERLHLFNCLSLVKLHPFIVTNLQKFDPFNCSSLVKLPSFIGDFTNLKEFDLSGCSSLVELPVSIGSATNLQKLDIRRCSSLVKLPSSIGNLQKLRELKMCGCSSLLKLPPSIETAINLKTLDLRGCSSLVELPSSIGDLINLTSLDLSQCSSLVELPSSIVNLQKLKKVRMCGCSKLEALPTNISLESLDELDLADCSQLKSFPEISTNIGYLNLEGTAIKEIPLSIMSWSHLSGFCMSYFESLKEYPHALDIIIKVAPWVSFSPTATIWYRSPNLQIP